MENLSVAFLSDIYTFPSDLCDYVKYLSIFDGIHNRLIQILNNQIQTKTWGCNGPEEVIFRERMESEGQIIIAMLSEKGIYDVTLSDLVKNTKGYQSIRTICQRTFDEIKNVMFRALNDFYDGYTQTYNSATSKIRGSGISIWTSSMSSMLLYSAIESSIIKKQCNQAEKEYSLQMDKLCRRNEDQIEHEKTEVLVSIYYPGIAQALSLFASEILQNFLHILSEHGLFDCSVITDYEIQRSTDLLKNLSVISDKESVIKEAFKACPYNPDVYMAVVECEIGDIETFATARQFHQDEILSESILLYCKENRLNSKSLKFPLSVLNLLASKEADDVLRDIFSVELSTVINQCSDLENAVSDKQKLDQWMRNNIAEDVSTIIQICDKTFVIAKIKSSIERILLSQEFQVLRDNHLIQSVEETVRKIIYPLTEAIIEYIREATDRKQKYDKAERVVCSEKEQCNRKISKLEAEMKSVGFFSFSRRKEIKKSIDTEIEKLNQLANDPQLQELKSNFENMYR